MFSARRLQRAVKLGVTCTCAGYTHAGVQGGGFQSWFMEVDLGGAAAMPGPSLAPPSPFATRVEPEVDDPDASNPPLSHRGGPR
jgi:hypothetical protein